MITYKQALQKKAAGDQVPYTPKDPEFWAHMSVNDMFRLPPPKQFDANGREIPVMSQGPVTYGVYKQNVAPEKMPQTWQEWVQKTPPNLRMQTFTDLPVAEQAKFIAAFAGDRLNDMLYGGAKVVNTVGQSAMNLAETGHQLGGLTSAAVDDAMAKGFDKIHPGSAEAYRARADQKRENLQNNAFTENIGHAANKMDAWIENYYKNHPNAVNDPYPSPFATSVMQMFGGDKPSYTSTDLIQRLGEYGGDYATVSMMPSFLQRLNDSPIQGTDIKLLRLKNPLIRHAVNKAAPGFAAATIDHVNKLPKSITKVVDNNVANKTNTGIHAVGDALSRQVYSY